MKYDRKMAVEVEEFRVMRRGTAARSARDAVAM